MDIFSKWQIAQDHERSFHGEVTLEKMDAYNDGYNQYFDYLHINPNLSGKTIIEIGPADIPALSCCINMGPSVIIEPLPSQTLKNLIKDLPIQIITSPAENVTFDKADEVWLFNVLQHVIAPDIIINNAKASAKIIRFFEPINDSVDICHLHTFTLDYFKNHFGDCVKHYEDHTGKVKNFHEHECAYGVWIKDEN